MSSSHHGLFPNLFPDQLPHARRPTPLHALCTTNIKHIPRFPHPSRQPRPYRPPGQQFIVRPLNVGQATQPRPQSPQLTQRCTCTLRQSDQSHSGEIQRRSRWQIRAVPQQDVAAGARRGRHAHVNARDEGSRHHPLRRVLRGPAMYVGATKRVVPAKKKTTPSLMKLTRAALGVPEW